MSLCHISHAGRFWLRRLRWGSNQVWALGKLRRLLGECQDCCLIHSLRSHASIETGTGTGTGKFDGTGLLVSCGGAA
jgi:hypothetical protein